MVSLIRLGAACFGVDWPGRWALWALWIAAAGLASIESQIARRGSPDHIDWETVPEPLRPVLRLTWKGGGALFFILALLCFWNGWARHKVAPHTVVAGLVALFFAWEAMFFSYGRTDTET